MKKYNNSKPGGNRAEGSEKPIRRTKPTFDSSKPRKQSFRRSDEENQQTDFTRKPRTTRSTTADNLGERPAFKRRGSTDATQPPRRKSSFNGKSAADEKPFERRSPIGKGAAAKRTYKRKEDEDTERKPFAGRTNKPFGEKRTFSDDRRKSSSDKRSPFGGKRSFSGEKRRYSEDSSNASEQKPNFSGEKRSPFGKKRTSEDLSGRRSRSADTSRVKKESADFKGKFDKKAAMEERPQKRSEREGYYTEKRKYTPASAKQQAPDYNLKKYDNKNPRAKQGKEVKDDTTRLNRYIANAGICSRREADKLIESGEIKVNGKVVTEMGYQVGTNDIVKYGNRVLNREKLVYVLLNKPKGYITTTDDPEERKTVMDLVGNACEQRIYPVGRLDRNTSGLLLFTNDGELAEKLAHPSNDIKKIYQVELDKPITKEDFQRVIDGVQLEDGLATVDEVAVITPDKTTLGIEIHIGRNRIVRRIFEHLGYEVVKLDRVSYAGLTKKDLPRGNWRFLSEKEVIKLKYFV
ncbi:pseudouridine synthase [Rhodocytophaga aerolata]|uniref:Pseudouridine synthase n=1 Tax=Rhodocytophaga aerolata TaxID=455078 RepID=A0ABT8R5X6_9BACT|nr:pseudouridine synthase [Rhodocytophaga aerolata]MDO1447501.1 pseudouridine synthase [Rhodocytophaga aerolata]